MTAQEKILFILAKIKEQWDLSPKSDYRETHRRYGIYSPANEMKIGSNRIAAWLNQCGLDFYEFERLLEILKQEGLVDDYRFFGDYE